MPSGISAQDQKIRWIQRPRQDMKTPLRLLSVYNIVTTRWSTQDVQAYANGKCTSMGKGKDPSRTGCILSKIRYLYACILHLSLICIISHFQSFFLHIH